MGYWDTSEETALLPPCVFELGNSSYSHARRAIRDQCVLGGSFSYFLADSPYLASRLQRLGLYHHIANTSAEGRQHLRLRDKATCRYLGQGSRNPRQNGRDNDGLRFEHPKHALTNAGFSKRYIAQTRPLAAPILRL